MNKQVRTIWELDLDCGTTVTRKYETSYPGVSVFDCPCENTVSCSVEYRRLKFEAPPDTAEGR